MRFLTRRRPGPTVLGAWLRPQAAAAVPVSASASTQASPVVGHVYVNDDTAARTRSGRLTGTRTGR